MQKVAVVTGSRRGIGKGIADALKNEGYLVVYSARTEDSKLENYCPCDISDERDREALLQFACRSLARDGVRRLFVTHGTINPTARGFWDRYFANYAFTMTRRIDPTMLGVIPPV